MLKISGSDFRLPGSNLSHEKIKTQLEETGFAFLGEPDGEGRVEITLPLGWSTEGDTGSHSTTWHILDKNGKRRLEVRRKIPWGDHDFISFVMVKSDISPVNFTHIKQGWQ